MGIPMTGMKKLVLPKMSAFHHGNYLVKFCTALVSKFDHSSSGTARSVILNPSSGLSCRETPVI